MAVVRVEKEWGGRRLALETGRLAKQANGAVLVSYGDTVVLATAVASRAPREGIDFFPLTIDYEERLYAVGRIPGGYIKREGRSSEKGILSARLTDRALRPLFPKGFHNDVQVVITVLSVDHDCPVEIAGMIGASAALHISDIPFDGPVSGSIVGFLNGDYVLNPTLDEDDESRMHLAVASKRDAVVMIEAGAHRVSEQEVLQAIRFGFEQNQAVIALQEELREKAGREKGDYPIVPPSSEIRAAVEEVLSGRLEGAMRNADKLQREADTAVLEQEVTAALAARFPGRDLEVQDALKAARKTVMRRLILREGVRADGRRLDEIRPITVEVSVLPRTHGSGLFTRGQTQVMTTCTLGAISDMQRLDDIGSDESKRYIHHYNFPPFSTGETRPLRAPSRRSIGHGALAERSLLPMIPAEEKFPYTIRLVSEVLESNGSTSMASVCGSTLALMDAGVPIEAPVAGIAMGLVKEGDEVAVLTDIQGLEDELGDMDFKVAGTADGVNAIQMDIKIAGLDWDILERALEQARKGRLFILGKMLEVLPEPRQEMSPHAPRITVLHINPDKIREVIGPGGKMINKIIDETKMGQKKVEIDIHDDGTIYIAAVNADMAQQAINRIQAIVKEPEVGEVYHGRVTRLMNFGAFVEILPGKEGLVHISQLALERVGKVEDVVQVGDELDVKVVEIDHMGRLNLSHKALLTAKS